jgi:hypothetical protein
MGYEKRYPDEHKYPANYVIRKDEKYLMIFDGYRDILIPIEPVIDFIKE